MQGAHGVLHSPQLRREGRGVRHSLQRDGLALPSLRFVPAGGPRVQCDRGLDHGRGDHSRCGRWGGHGSDRRRDGHWGDRPWGDCCCCDSGAGQQRPLPLPVGPSARHQGLVVDQEDVVLPRREGGVCGGRGFGHGQREGCARKVRCLVHILRPHSFVQDPRAVRNHPRICWQVRCLSSGPQCCTAELFGMLRVHPRGGRLLRRQRRRCCR
mmetsp:Transcript_60293/g.152636  ORF Transcript_60293/g.152636 Transcript_60293/m.152636 type:complete len:211 (+) Transcript_60293:395-1027(+)